MTNAKTTSNGMHLAVAASTLAGFGMHRPPAEIPHTASSRHSITNQKSAIKTPSVWAFRVGGYQVCEKWLKDRQGRPRDYADLQHYQKIVGALRDTIGRMDARDQTIEAHGGCRDMFL